jgi:hypothetical protein
LVTLVRKLCAHGGLEFEPVVDAAYLVSVGVS